MCCLSTHTCGAFYNTRIQRSVIINLLQYQSITMRKHKQLEQLIEIETKLITQNEWLVTTRDESQQILERAAKLENPLQNLCRAYQDALVEGQQLDIQLTNLEVNKKAESDLQNLSGLLGLGCTVLPSTVKDEPPIYKFHIHGHSVTVQMPDKQMKLIEMTPMQKNFENIKNELASSQDLKGLLIAIKMATTKPATKCS